MPTQDRVGCEQSTNLFEQLTTQDFTTDGQPASLIIVEQDSLFAQLFFKDLILDSQVVDRFLLLPINPASENEQVQLPRLKDEIHVPGTRGVKDVL
jgi:hypothetical protein